MAENENLKSLLDIPISAQTKEKVEAARAYIESIYFIILTYF